MLGGPSVATTLNQSLADQLSRVIQQRQGEDPAIQKQVMVPVTRKSPQEIRAKNNGRLNYPRTPLVDVYQDEISDALSLLNNQGNYADAARISDLAMSTDSWVAGVFGTFTSSISSLPKRFVGDETIKRDLSQGFAGIEGDPRSLFDVIVRPSVFTQLLIDMRMLGTAVAEMVWLPSLSYPVVCNLSAQFLSLDRYSNTWYYRTDTGQFLEIIPGDGRWILLTGNATEPWKSGIWASVCRDYARKTEALLNLDAWQRKHASPIRVGKTAAGATSTDYDEYLEQLVEWTGVNTVAVLPQGWDLSLVETNGQGYQAYAKTVEMMNESLSVAIAGQSITTVGSQGFANGEVGLTVRGDLTKKYAKDIAHGLSEQLLPYVVASRYGSVDRKVSLVIETDPPKDKTDAAKALVESAAAIRQVVETSQLARELGFNAYQPDIAELQRQFGIPIAEIQPPPPAPAPVAPAPVAPTPTPVPAPAPAPEDQAA